MLTAPYHIYIAIYINLLLFLLSHHPQKLVFVVATLYFGTLLATELI